MDFEKLGIDPNSPAFGEGAGSTEDLEKQPEAEATAEKATEQPEAKEQETEAEEETSVKYSRFKKFHDLAKQAQAEAETYKAELERLRAQAQPQKPIEESVDMPDYWRKLYGDSAESVEGWKLQSQLQKSLADQIRKEALDAVKAERQAELKRVESNEELIDSSLEALSDYAGHDLTEDEKSGVLEVIDDLSPKDQDGNFTVTIPWEKAYDIFQMKQQVGRSAKTAARNKVAQITNAKSQGAASDQAENNKDFNPLDWDAARRRLGN